MTVAFVKLADSQIYMADHYTKSTRFHDADNDKVVCRICMDAVRVSGTAYVGRTLQGLLYRIYSRAGRSCWPCVTARRPLPTILLDGTHREDGPGPAEAARADN